MNKSKQKSKRQSIPKELKDLYLVGVLSLAVGVFGTLGINALINSDFKGAEVPKNVVALLDGEEITSKELYEEMVLLYGEEALDSLVSEKIANKEAESRDIEVKEEDIKKQMDSIKSSFTSDEEYKQTLASQGQTEEDLRQDVISYLRLVELLTELIDTSDEKLKAEFESNKESYSQKEQVNADHILVDDEALAKEIYQKISNGENFKDLAKEYSKDFKQGVENGANLGYFGRDEMIEEFEKVVFAMKPGEISQPFKSEFGWHIAKVNDKVEAKEAVFDEVKEQIKNKLIDQGLSQAYTEWILEMKEKYGYENKLGTDIPKVETPTTSTTPTETIEQPSTDTGTTSDSETSTETNNN